MLTDDTLRKVRETARIDEVASGYLTLHRSGKDFVALCPFHDERHPSFRVSPARNIGKCFSCGEAADPIRLVCHMEGCGFEEAVRLLARKYNIEMEETAAAGRERRRDEREALLLANASFASGLLPGHPVGTARTVEDRHGLEETYRGFGVGLCPPNVPQVFRPFLGRLIFPIHTTGGQVAGFAGRSLTPSEKGRKYVNSPDSPAYHKGHILYGLHKAVKAVRSEGDPALRGIQGRARLPRLRHTVRRGAMRHGAHRGAYPGDTEAGRAGDALSRSRSGGTAEHGPVRPYAPVRGMRRQPASPARRHGPGRGVPPERERRAGTPSTGGYPRLPLLPHPPSGFPPSHGHRRHQRDVGRDRPPLLPAGRVPKDRGAIRSDGNTDRGTTAGNLRRHRPENVPVPVPKKEAAGLTPTLPRERTLLRFCLTHHDRMFYDPDGNEISLPAWVSGELADNELPLEDPEHARLLHLLSEGKHPDGIADERLSALVLSLRASAPQDTGPVPDERLPGETRFQVLLYGESFARRKLARTLESVRTAATPEERLRLQATLENHFALSDRIARELQSQSILPEGI